MFVMCFSTEGGASTSSVQMAEFDSPWATSASTSRSRGVSAVTPWSRLFPSEQLPDDLRVHHGAAPGDPFDRVQELVQRGHPVLEQVADRAVAVGEQLGGVGALDVLGQDQDRRPRLALAH
jgi:hypothetical protein